jgi:hypothetical protein
MEDINFNIVFGLLKYNFVWYFPNVFNYIKYLKLVSILLEGILNESKYNCINNCCFGNNCN